VCVSDGTEDQQAGADCSRLCAGASRRRGMSEWLAHGASTDNIGDA